MQVLNVGVPDIEFKLFAPQKEAQELCVFLLFVGLHTRSGVYDYIVTQPLLPISISVFYFFFFTRCRSHSASFWISFRENYSLYSCRFGMSLVGGKLWIPLHCHQELEPLKVFYYQITQFDNKILMDYSLGYKESNCNFWSSHFT